MDDDLDNLIAQHGGYWGEHPKYVVADWQTEVMNGETRRGYWAWVESQIANQED